MTEAEFLPLFDQYRPMVYGLALSYTRSPQDAEDVCQEVFLTLLEKPPAPGKERPWLARVAVNRCRDLLTSPWRRRRENDDTALERLTFETPEEAGLFAALGALSPDSRALLHLRYYEGFTVAELARQFRTTAPALSARLYRAKQQLRKKLEEKQVEIRGDEDACAIEPSFVRATEEDWGREYLDYILSLKLVDSVDEAIRHINTYNTGHSETIVTSDYFNAQTFLNEVDAAAVYVNASTRFTDGEEFGFGAEIGISTQKLHARGPMGLKELTTTKYIIYGDGQIR